jgi:hypothetical protein
MGVTIKQVEEAKLLGITLDGQLSWSNPIDKVAVKKGRGMSYKNIFCVFDTNQLY